MFHDPLSRARGRSWKYPIILFRRKSRITEDLSRLEN